MAKRKMTSKIRIDTYNAILKLKEASFVFVPNSNTSIAHQVRVHKQRDIAAHFGRSLLTGELRAKKRTMVKVDGEWRDDLHHHRNKRHHTGVKMWLHDKEEPMVYYEEEFPEEGETFLLSGPFTDKTEFGD